MMKFQHSGIENPQHKPRLLRLTPATHQGFLNTSLNSAMESFQDAFISKILLYRLASSFSPMRYHRNRIMKGAENLFFGKKATR